VVERYRPSVQTQRLAPLSDISDADCKTVEMAMTKCSTWLPGHDKAPAVRAPVPVPVAYSVIGNGDQARQYLVQQVAALGERADEAANRYRRFAKAFLEGDLELQTLNS